MDHLFHSRVGEERCAGPGRGRVEPMGSTIVPLENKLHKLAGFEIGKPAFQFAGDADPDDASADDEEAAGCQAMSLREKHGSGF